MGRPFRHARGKLSRFRTPSIDHGGGCRLGQSRRATAERRRSAAAKRCKKKTKSDEAAKPSCPAGARGPQTCLYWQNPRPRVSPMTDLISDIAFDSAGLIPAIAQQHDTGEVLMLAWMDRAAVEETFRTGRACYYSRSRGRPWRKGESSGQVQHVVEIRIDCDGDAVLLLVAQEGVACHTGRRSCFFRAARDQGWRELTTPDISPKILYG